jgi:pimeloyl-ACP methyl ester carboxylesterase
VNRPPHALLLPLAVLLGALAPSSCADTPKTATNAPLADDAVTSTDGVRIHYRSAGAGTEAVVLLHCWGCNARYWDAVVERVTPHHRVVTIDLAGHGRSGKDRTSWTVRAFAEDVRAVVDHLGLSRVVLVGHSMSGPIALEAVKILGPRVIAIAPVDTLKNAEKTSTPEELATFFDPMKADFAGTTTKVVKSLFPKDADPKVVDRILADELRQDPTIAVPMLEASFAYDACAALRATTVPILAINSTLSPTRTEANRRCAPQFEAALIGGAGHWPMLETPATFAAMIDDATRDWLDPTRTEGFATSKDGAKIHYRARGKGELPAVVFVHGWMGSSRWWDDAMTRLAPTRRVVAIDLAGHGLSQASRAEWTPQAFAEDVTAVVSALALPRVVLVGHSMSGPITALAAKELGQKVAAIVPVDTLLDVEEKPIADGQKLLDAMRADFRAAVPMMFAYLFSDSTPKAVRERLTAEIGGGNAEMAAGILERAWALDKAEALRGLTLPIRAINSDRFPTRVDTNRKYAPDFDVTVLPGVGHYPMLETPDAFLAALERILAKVR